MRNDMDTVKARFTDAMREIYRRAATELDYRPVRFLQMVEELGGVAAATELLAAPLQEGFTTLWEHGRLDLSMEALVLQPRWRPLFTDGELAEARRRLDEAGYTQAMEAKGGESGSPPSTGKPRN